MDVEFMLSDSLDALKTKIAPPKSLEEAAQAVDAMFTTAFQTAGRECTLPISRSACSPHAVPIGEGEDADGDDSGDESDEDGERPMQLADDASDDDGPGDSPTEETRRGPSPEPAFVVRAQESLGPSEEAEAEFARELAKMVTDTSAEARKVDRRTAQALWEMPAVVRPKRRGGEEDGEGGGEQGVMRFTVLARRGNRQTTRQLAVPSESALAVQTRTAQMQDLAEHQQLKRLVLDYEQREEAEELKGTLRVLAEDFACSDFVDFSSPVPIWSSPALEARSRAIKVRHAG
jgi:regulator of nonsense transcripts 2